MKKIIVALAINSIGSLLFAQVEIPNAPQWQVTVHVTDQGGAPIANANASAGYYIPAPPNATEAESRKTGDTDTNGLVTLTAHSGPRIWYSASKEGYYATTGAELPFKDRVGDQWLPWNPTLEVGLKKIIDPIAMYAKKIDSEPPANGTPVGYDLMIGDWVAPYGKGNSSDILFLREYSRKSFDDYDYKLTVSFPNKGDGIQLFAPTEVDSKSDFKSTYQAPESGYESKITRVNISHPPDNVKWDHDPKREYFFRVRTILGENGQVREAFYGKIYGDFMQFSYYLNSISNSRNVEFNPKQNLIGGLNSRQEVTAP